MKKTPQKLVLRTETLRALANIDLARAVGGLNSGAVQCPLVDSGKINCDTDVVVTATTACPPQ
jgi:hypothetical protein